MNYTFKILFLTSSFFFLQSGHALDSQQYASDTDYDDNSIFLQKEQLPEHFEDEYKITKALWKRGLSLESLDKEEMAMDDFSSVIEMAENHGFVELDATDKTPYHYINNEGSLPLSLYGPYEEESLTERGKRYYAEKKEAYKSKWGSVRKNAKEAWKFMKEKHRKHREKSLPEYKPNEVE